MSEDFSLKTLMGLVRAARSFAARGDNLPKALSEEHRQIVVQAAHAMIDRIVNAHLSPDAGDPELSIRDVLGMTRAIDAFLAHGDGHPATISPDVAVATFSARMVLLSRIAEHPNGDLVAESLGHHPNAVLARAVATRAREVVLARAKPEQAEAPVEVAPAATFQEPVPASDPAAPAADAGDAFRFGPPEPARVEQPEPDPEPVNLGPTQPAPVTPPEAGKAQAQ